MNNERRARVLESVKALLKAEGIQPTDKERAIRCLSQCVASKLCIAVYLENTK